MTKTWLKLEKKMIKNRAESAAACVLISLLDRSQNSHTQKARENSKKSKTLATWLILKIIVLKSTSLSAIFCGVFNNLCSQFFDKSILSLQCNRITCVTLFFNAYFWPFFSVLKKLFKTADFWQSCLVGQFSQNGKCMWENGWVVYVPRV